MDRIVRKGFERERVPIFFDGVSRTKQSFVEQCDINTIMKKFLKTGIVEHVERVNGQYGDFVGALEYHEAYNAVIAADQAFKLLPAELRNRFKNDVPAFLAFVHDPANEAEMIELGLLEPVARRLPEAAEGSSPEGQAPQPPASVEAPPAAPEGT